MNCYSPNCNNRVVYQCESKKCSAHGCDNHIREYLINGTRRMKLCSPCALLIAVLARVDPDPYK